MRQAEIFDYLPEGEAMTAPPISVPDAAGRLGLSYRQVDCWIRAGYLDGVDPDGPGSGRSREVTPDQFRLLALIADLRTAGFGVKAAVGIAVRVGAADQTTLALTRTVQVKIDRRKHA